eukprot:3433277-Heterocapsa_arctica.AAC.1
MEFGRLRGRRKGIIIEHGACVLCGALKAGVEHIWWECPVLNGVINFGLLKLKQRRAKEGHEPECFWLAGSVPSDWTTLPDTENMKAMDV